MKYRHRPIEVEAKQWTRENLGEVFGWLKVFGVNAKATTSSSLVIPAKNGSVVCEPGDYVVKGLENNFFAVKPELFKQNYEPLHKETEKVSLDAKIVGQKEEEVGVQVRAPFIITKKEKEDMGLKVDSGIGIPSKSKETNHELREQVLEAGRSMDVGDSVFLPCKDARELDNKRNSFLQILKRNLSAKKKFTSRAVTEGGQYGVRIWRIA